LFGGVSSFVALVVPLMVDDPVVVGIPVTVHRMLEPGASNAGDVGLQTVVSPAGSPATEQVGEIAATKGAAPFVHLNVPL
jgi:hypothetical protein